MSGLDLIEVLAAICGGAALSALHLVLIGRSVAGLASGGSPARIIGFGLVRLASAAAVFGVAAFVGAATLLLALAGFTVTRLALVERLAGRRR